MDASPAVVASAAYEGEIARDLARRAAFVAPAVLVVAAVLRGGEGAASAAVGLVLVVLNFLAGARVVTWAAQRSPGAVMAVALAGYLVRIATLFGIVLLLEPLSWIDVPVLVLTIAVVHLALLTWETRHVSLTLAFPGLKPGHK
jgi:hypothetical protein